MHTHSYAFISGPYKESLLASTDYNIHIAQECAVWLANEGYYPITPHLLTYKFETLADQPDAFYLDMYLGILRSGLIDLVVMLPHWRESAGARSEFSLASRLGIPTYSWTAHEGLVRFPCQI